MPELWSGVANDIVWVDESDYKEDDAICEECGEPTDGEHAVTEWGELFCLECY